jgi:hypothetical protein
LLVVDVPFRDTSELAFHSVRALLRAALDVRRTKLCLNDRPTDGSGCSPFSSYRSTAHQNGAGMLVERRKRVGEGGLAPVDDVCAAYVCPSVHRCVVPAAAGTEHTSRPCRPRGGVEAGPMRWCVRLTDCT